LAHDIIVVKHSLNSKAAAIALAYRACHLPGTLNTQLFTAITWRGNKHLNADITSDGWAPRATDKRSIERNIISKATLRELAAVIPVENYGKLQLVSHSGPAFGSAHSGLAFGSASSE
jgi:hypothetical protein